jgi:uncharacterized protein (UPF0335 family)
MQVEDRQSSGRAGRRQKDNIKADVREIGRDVYKVMSSVGFDVRGVESVEYISR